MYTHTLTHSFAPLPLKLCSDKLALLLFSGWLLSNGHPPSHSPALSLPHTVTKPCSFSTPAFSSYFRHFSVVPKHVRVPPPLAVLLVPVFACYRIALFFSLLKPSLLSRSPFSPCKWTLDCKLKLHWILCKILQRMPRFYCSNRKVHVHVAETK